uniref:Uncharacterized protein n=1 Tax=Zea mays TaxID=4577 RepID=B7ZZC2_MAIZE|nr:unknown [Zea mays]
MIPSNHNVLIKTKQVGANASIKVRLELRQSHLQHVWYEEAEGICIFHVCTSSRFLTTSFASGYQQPVGPAHSSWPRRRIY